MTYRLHCFAESGNTYKVALYLNCAGLDWEPVTVDYFNGQTHDADWRHAHNAMGEAPVLEVDGHRLTQSGAILTWLADTTGHFAGVDETGRYEALRWILFDNHKFTSYFATYRFMKSLAPEPPDPAVLEFLKKRIDGNFNLVNQHLATREFLIADQPSIADFSLAGYLFYPREQHGYDFADAFPHLDAWRQRIKTLPGWMSPHDLMPAAGSASF